MLEKAEQWSQATVGNQLLPLPRLAALLGVHVRTLRLAARDGRLEVSYRNRTLFGHPIPLATPGAGSAFMRIYYRKTTRWSLRPPKPEQLPLVPGDYDSRLRVLRRHLGLTQAELALRLGVAGKAVVYQSESGKRRPSPVLWQRIITVEWRDER
jgi:DNA-binding XRE family transcriptional regulator